MLNEVDFPRGSGLGAAACRADPALRVGTAAAAAAQNMTLQVDWLWAKREDWVFSPARAAEPAASSRHVVVVLEPLRRQRNRIAEALARSTVSP
jgi:hypothetical protein